MKYGIFVIYHLTCMCAFHLLNCSMYQTSQRYKCKARHISVIIISLFLCMITLTLYKLLRNLKRLSSKLGQIIWTKKISEIYYIINIALIRSYLIQRRCPKLKVLKPN